MFIDTVISVLSTTLPRWESLTSSLPEELLWRRPAEGEWSAMECLQHLVDTERHVFPKRVVAFLQGQGFAAFNPDTMGSVGVTHPRPDELAAEFAEMRVATLELLGTLQEGDLSRRVTHQELGPVTLEEMLNEWAAHELMHMVQAERALMQPFIHACGPWEVYFKEHVVE